MVLSSTPYCGILSHILRQYVQYFVCEYLLEISLYWDLQNYYFYLFILYIYLFILYI